MNSVGYSAKYNVIIITSIFSVKGVKGEPTFAHLVSLVHVDCGLSLQPHIALVPIDGQDTGLCSGADWL